MTTICWTVIHHAAAPFAHGLETITHPARRIIGSAVHHAMRPRHHGAIMPARPRVWIELVCKLVPAAVAGGGLLIPFPANPPAREPPALIQPAPPAPVPGVPLGTPIYAPLGWIVAPNLTRAAAPPPDTTGSAPPGHDVIEPSTARLLATALGGLTLIRIAIGSLHSHRGQPRH